MCLHPLPGGLDNHTQVLRLRLPTQLALYLLRTGDQNRWIAGTSGSHSSGDAFPGQFASRFQYLIHTVTISTTAEVVDASAAILERLQRENVRAREIDHVNVVAHAGPVGRR